MYTDETLVKQNLLLFCYKKAKYKMKYNINQETQEKLLENMNLTNSKYNCSLK